MTGPSPRQQQHDLEDARTEVIQLMDYIATERERVQHPHSRHAYTAAWRAAGEIVATIEAQQIALGPMIIN